MIIALLLLYLWASAAAASSVSRQVSGACTNPLIRKEWRELTFTEKIEYIRATLCLRILPKQQYANITAVVFRLDDLTYTHLMVAGSFHLVARFLRWHRWFVQLHEDLLRTECGFTGTQPYWDWSIDADARNVSNSPVFDPVTGFGGNGKLTGSNELGFRRCVVDGPFANTTLTLGKGWCDTHAADHAPHCLYGEFHGDEGVDEHGEQILGDMKAEGYDTKGLNTMVYSRRNFYQMQGNLEFIHTQIHQIISGDFAPNTSPNEPLFFLLHANVDRIWAQWQGRNATRLVDYAGPNTRFGKMTDAQLHDTMPIMELGNVPPVVQNYLDTQAGPLCYTYSDM